MEMVESPNRFMFFNPNDRPLVAAARQEIADFDNAFTLGKRYPVLNLKDAVVGTIGQSVHPVMGILAQTVDNMGRVQWVNQDMFTPDLPMVGEMSNAPMPVLEQNLQYLPTQYQEKMDRDEKEFKKKIMEFETIVENVNSSIASKNIFDKDVDGPIIKQNINCKAIQDCKQIEEYESIIEWILFKTLIKDILQEVKVIEWDAGSSDKLLEKSVAFQKFLENNCTNSTEWMLSSPEIVWLITIPQAIPADNSHTGIDVYQAGVLNIGKQTLNMFADPRFHSDIVLVGNTSCGIKLEKIDEKMNVCYKKHFDSNNFFKIKINNFI